MNRERLRELLSGVRRGEVSVASALARLRTSITTVASAGPAARDQAPFPMARSSSATKSVSSGAWGATSR